MPNTKDVVGPEHENVFLVGPPGSGKTTQFWTLPGRKFLYIFDPNALASLRGLDADYEIFAPDLLDINVHPLKKERTGDSIVKAREPVAYTNWETDFDNKDTEGFFDQYDVIGFDSFTTFQDMVMDRVQFLNGRFGKMPEQADWAAQMITVQNVIRSFAAMNKLLVCTGHEEARQDELTKRIFFQPMLTGRLRTRIPLLFSNIFRCEVGRDKDGNAEWSFHTVGDTMHQYVRTSIRGLYPVEDVTIRDWEQSSNYGLGLLLREAGIITKTGKLSDSN